MKILIGFLLVFFVYACNLKSSSVADKKLLDDSNVLHNNQQQLTNVIIYDVFSPPVASRIYAYTALASYEAMRFSEKNYPSIASQLHGFPALPIPEEGKKYNFLLAATKAFFTVAQNVKIFSYDSTLAYQEKLYSDFRSLLEPEIFDRSVAFGEAIGKKILERAAKDNYKETRGMEKYLGSKEKGKWQPTAPDYNDGVEPYWHLLRPLVLDSANQCKALPAPVYKIDTTSEFYKTTYEVYAIGKNITEDQKTIARYWDDNPFVTEHSGHLMYGNKKITPVGHWMGITDIACKLKKTDPVETAQAFAMTAIAIFDSFIACFEEKYKSQLVRPITVINELIDRNWQPFLQTPAFPEHTSGHSTISAAAASVLTQRFGDNFKFEDTSDMAYIGMKREFSSFLAAANEASISRLYGGIHYRTGITAGSKQGMEVARLINERIRLHD
ncbi:MAG TPA: vanadium-dependent haloperoxidase [Flavitalea sp.]|nr:vanadium-dependent haloperoxidase [Flavitalea sp.]